MWDVTPCRWASSFRRFGGSTCLHLEGEIVQEEKNILFSENKLIQTNVLTVFVLLLHLSFKRSPCFFTFLSACLSFPTLLNRFCPALIISFSLFLLNCHYSVCFVSVSLVPVYVICFRSFFQFSLSFSYLVTCRHILIFWFNSVILVELVQRCLCRLLRLVHIVLYNFCHFICGLPRSVLY